MLGTAKGSRKKPSEGVTQLSKLTCSFKFLKDKARDVADNGIKEHQTFNDDRLL